MALKLSQHGQHLLHLSTERRYSLIIKKLRNIALVAHVDYGKTTGSSVFGNISSVVKPASTVTWIMSIGSR